MPEDVCFRTKPQLAQLMPGAQSPSLGLPGTRSTSDRKLRLCQEREEYVMAKRSTRSCFGRTIATGEGRMASGVEESAWVRCSAGNQRTGLRLGCRGRPLRTGQGPLAAGPSQPCQAWGVDLLRLRPGETALEELVRVAGRWAIEECFERPREKWDWTSTRCASGGMAGTGTSL